jgi:Protein of unknown function (DUF3592)
MRFLVMFGPILIVLFFVGWRVLQAVKSRRGDDAGHWLTAISPIMLLLSVAALGAGIAVLQGTGVYPSLRGYVAARSWIATPCTVLESAVESQRGFRSGTVSRLSIRYAYEVAGRRFEGHRYEFGAEGFSGGDAAQRIADSLPPGSATTCYVDPGDPERAVITRDFSQDLIAVGVPGLIFVGAGVGMLVANVRQARSRTRDREPLNP